MTVVGAMESSIRLQSRLIFCVLAAGLLYFIFCLYYAARRLNTDEWNRRPARFSPHLWIDDPDLEKIHARMEHLSHTLSSEVTIITAYFDIGSLNKGGVFGKYTPERYKQWMSVFGRIDNPLIVFTDSEEVMSIFKSIRKHFPANRTQISIVQRENLWAFKLAPEIKSVFSQPGYPQHDPNTVHENYSCVMHAKFELVNYVIKNSLFHTKYIAWLDIGLFRAVVHEKHIFPLVVPSDFNPDKVAYSEQKEFDSTLTPFEIISENLVWVGGAMFLGRPEVLYVYTHDYINAVKKLLNMKIMSTDQQVIYIMYQPSFNFQPRVEIQVYTTHSEDDWFYLGYIIKDAWDIGLRGAEPVVKFLHSLLN